MEKINRISKNFDWLETQVKNKDNEKYVNKIIEIILNIEQRFENKDYGPIFNLARKTLEYAFRNQEGSNFVDLNNSIKFHIRKYSLTAEAKGGLKNVQNLGNEGSHSQEQDWKASRDNTIYLIQSLWQALKHLFEIRNLEFHHDVYSSASNTASHEVYNHSRTAAAQMPAKTNGLMDFVMDPKNKFYIPHYQREYVWKIDQIENLFEDMMKRNKDGNSHHMGVLALSRDTKKDRIRVIDGQQRITTTLLLLLAYKETFEEKKTKLENNIFNDWQKNINEKYENVDSEIYDSLKKLLLGGIQKSQRQLSSFEKNYQKVRECIRTYEKSNEISRQEQFEIFRKKFVISYYERDYVGPKIELETFENINSKVEPLKNFELIENLLISSINEKYLSNERKIKQIINDNINIIFKENNIKERQKDKCYEFINELLYYWKDKGISKSKSTKYKIYNRFKKHWKVDNGFSLIEFTKEIQKLSLFVSIYSQLQSKKILELQVFRELKTRLSVLLQKDIQFPLLTFVLIKTCNLSNNKIISVKNKKTLEDMIYILSTYIVRLTATSGTAQNNRMVYAKALQKLRNENIKNMPKQLWRHLVESESFPMPSKNAFEDALKNTPSETWLHKAVLIETEKFLLNSKNVLKNQDLIKLNDIHLEHILPEKPKKQIRSFDNYDEVIQKIGNKIILDSKTNLIIKNKSFKEKKELYPKETFKLINGYEDFKLKSILNYKRFEKKEIDLRSEEVSKIAASGPFKDFSFKD